jgi:hypothetical protein
MITISEQLICIVQQAEQERVFVVNGQTLEVVGPEPAAKHFKRVMRWFQAEAARREPGLCTREASSSVWGQAFSESCSTGRTLGDHENRLLRHCLSRTVDIIEGSVRAGRLEGVAPGRCFVTPTPYSVTTRDFANSANRLVSVPSHLVKFSSFTTASQHIEEDGGLAL